MTLGEETTKADVITSFQTHPMAKKALPEGLEDAWFLSALAQYELEIDDLDYNEATSKFSTKLNRSVVYTLGLLMYLEYVTRELSRAEKLNGFYGKDIHLTGSDSSKNVTYKDLVLEKERIQELLHKQKVHGFN
jgi:hypothetical protein